MKNMRFHVRIKPLSCTFQDHGTPGVVCCFFVTIQITLAALASWRFIFSWWKIAFSTLVPV